MPNLLTIVQVISGIILIILILLQAKGIGLGRSVSGGNYHSKRGMEVVVFRLTIIMAVLFVILSIAGQLVI